ncbi:MAG: N-glycosylase/DNA lyase [Chloracidobacterium sp.]|nr:N-glycosylase/DNA lyase [Chloracidobacterium sp.]MCO5333655.1 N-glycosylase/DNA lyase [Pyrinomonadaceae bacterium]
MSTDTAPPMTRQQIKRIHAERREEICRRLDEFAVIGRSGTDHDLWAEMVFCFFTGGCSAAMGIRALEAVRHLLMSGTQEQLAAALSGVHRYPNARSRYIVASREFLTADCNMKLRKRLNSFASDIERRDWLVNEKGIKGLGYKEASHYLRNIGFRGYAILDKHILNSLSELKIIEAPKPPNNRSKYLSIENRLRDFAISLKIDLDELDLVLWSMRTGKILK